MREENKIISQNADTAFQDGLNEAQDLYAEQVKKEIKSEAYNECIEKVKENLKKLPQWICRRAEFQNIGFSYDEVFFCIEKTKNELVNNNQK